MGMNKGLYIPRELLTDDQIGSTQKIVYALMLEMADEDGVCRASSQRIGERFAKNERAVQASRRELCRLGYAELVKGTSKNYRLLKYRRKRDG